jgi:hypothetical protein
MLWTIRSFKTRVSLFSGTIRGLIPFLNCLLFSHELALLRFAVELRAGALAAWRNASRRESPGRSSGSGEGTISIFHGIFFWGWLLFAYCRFRE